MVQLTALWLPIVLSAVVVFVASSVLHMVLKYHQSDYSKLAGEDAVMAAMREAGVKPGHYYVPHCVDPKEMANEDLQAKFKQGPVAFLNVLPAGVPSMGKSLLGWFIHALVISLFVGYLASRTRGAGAEYLEVFRVCGTAAFLGYSGSQAAESIWKGLPWSVSIKHIFDGFVYALLTAGVFGWLWPA